MANSREVVLKLVRIAMGWENDFSFPEDINWKEVLNIASEQGVEAIVIDGYEILKKKNPQIKLSLDSSENKSLLLEAIGRLKLIEYGNLQQLEALTELSKIFHEKQIPFLLMKGFACGRYYPNPLHRPCGDIDIYPGDRFTESNETLKAAGIDVDPYYYRHTASMIKGVMIENHRVLGDLRGPHRQTRDFEAQLESEAKNSIKEGKDVIVGGREFPGAKYPTANFNALFLPWHVSAHFAFERVTLRHLLDWALFLINEGKDIEVGWFRESKTNYTYGYSKFVDILTNLSVRYLKIPVDSIPTEIVNDALGFNTSLADKVFDYMFVGQLREQDDNVWKFRMNNVKRVWKERWKYKELYNMTTLGFLSKKVVSVVCRVGEHEE